MNTEITESQGIHFVSSESQFINVVLEWLLQTAF